MHGFEYPPGFASGPAGRQGARGQVGIDGREPTPLAEDDEPDAESVCRRQSPFAQPIDERPKFVDLDVDVTGVFASCQAEGRAMIRNGGGAIVNIASMSARIANRGLQQVHYNSAKAAVVQLSASLALEWVDRRIRVNSLSPGYTATPMNLRPEMVDRMRTFAESVPMQRVAEPHEIAGPAVFLLSDAASYITGTDLLVDGGACAW